MILAVIVELWILGKMCFFPRMVGKTSSTTELGIVLCRVWMKKWRKFCPQEFMHSPQAAVDFSLVYNVELFKLWISGFMSSEGTDIFGECFNDIVHFS